VYSPIDARFVVHGVVETIMANGEKRLSAKAAENAKPGRHADGGSL
jgi:hypothetical protein